jgi:hypothetical protein
MATVKVSDITQTVFDLESFAEVTLVKEAPPFQEVSSVDEALSRIGNDSNKLLEVINRGLVDEYRNQIREDENIPWHTFDEEGEVNGPFEGTIAETKSVNALVLTLAKTVFGYVKDMPKELKKAAKASAMEMVKSTDAIKAGLRKSAAKKASA